MPLSHTHTEAIKIIMNAEGEDIPTQTTMPSDVEPGILTARGMFRPGENLTRADAAVWIYNGIK